MISSLSVFMPLINFALNSICYLINVKEIIYFVSLFSFAIFVTHKIKWIQLVVCEKFFF